MAGAGNRSGGMRRQKGGGLSKATGSSRQLRQQFKAQRGRAKAMGITGVKAYGR